MPQFLGLLGEAYGQARRTEDGLAAVAEALVLVDDTEQRCWQAELYRIKGNLLLAASSSHHVEAESCLSQALDIARRQQAKSWELRAGISLGRLWQQQSKAEEAREMLGEIYGWFTEGFETADLKEARNLVEDLAGPKDVRFS